MSFLGSLLFNITLYGSLPFISAVILVAYPFVSAKILSKIVSFWISFILKLLRFLCSLDWEVKGLSNIPNSPVIVISNHQGQWEAFSMQYLFHPLCTLLKRELLYIPLWGWAMGLLKPIAINRGRPREALRQALDEGGDRLDRGLFVLFFPEGTRVKAGQVNRYSRSSFELALRSNVPVLPIVHNSGDCWPAHKFLKYPGTIFLTIGKPRKVVDAKESAREVESWARTSLKRSLNV